MAKIILAEAPGAHTDAKYRILKDTDAECNSVSIEIEVDGGIWQPMGPTCKDVFEAIRFISLHEKAISKYDN